MIEAWQKENEGFFFVNGTKYLELMKTQQENRKREKNLVKLGKVKIITLPCHQPRSQGRRYDCSYVAASNNSEGPGNEVVLSNI